MSVAAYCGVDTWTANDAERALELAREILPDAIILDVRLLGTDGLTFARWIRSDERFNATTVIAVTGYANVGAACLEAGCDDFMLKPPNVADICALIEKGRTA